MLNTIDKLIGYSLLSGCLTLISITPTIAKTPENSQTLAQVQYAQTEYEWNSEDNQNSESYLVVVDNTESRLLQQVQLIEPSAFAGEFQGRSAIQAGVFRRLNNAEKRIRQLQAYGVPSRIYSRTTGREIINSYNDLNNSNSSGGSDPYARNNNDKKKRTKYYYVAIPEKPDKLFQIEDQIKQSAGGNSVGVAVRNAPRGPHVAVGPFSGRLQAEQWNYYIRSLGLNNARVYYGK